MLRRIVLMCALGLALALGAAPASAHVHHTEKNPNHDQELASGQNHPAFDPATGLSCWSGETGGPWEDGAPGPSWYGMETAHHGPEVGTPGRGANDGCYQAASVPPADGNPAIK
jgi:hypothetical protein